MTLSDFYRIRSKCGQLYQILFPSTCWQNQLWGWFFFFLHLQRPFLPPSLLSSNLRLLSLSLSRCGADGHWLAYRKLLLCGWRGRQDLCVWQGWANMCHPPGPGAVQPQRHCSGPLHGVSLITFSPSNALNHTQTNADRVTMYICEFTGCTKINSQLWIFVTSEVQEGS